MHFSIAEGYKAKCCLNYLQFSPCLHNEYLNLFATTHTTQIELILSKTWCTLHTTECWGLNLSVNILARRKFLLILHRLKHLLWSVSWPLDPCRSFQRAQLCYTWYERSRVGLSQWFSIFVSWPLRFWARRARGNSCSLTWLKMPFRIAEGYIAKRCPKHLQFSSFLPGEYFNSFSTAYTSEIVHMMSATWSIIILYYFFKVLNS